MIQKIKYVINFQKKNKEFDEKKISRPLRDKLRLTRFFRNVDGTGSRAEIRISSHNYAR